MLPEEIEQRKVMRCSIVATIDLKAGKKCYHSKFVKIKVNDFYNIENIDFKNKISRSEKMNGFLYFSLAKIMQVNINHGSLQVNIYQEMLNLRSAK